MLYKSFVRSLIIAILCVSTLVSSLVSVKQTRAAGTVGNGTPASCTEAELNLRLSGGGDVYFACGATKAQPVTITITSQILIQANTRICNHINNKCEYSEIDRGTIILHAVNNNRIFSVNPTFSLELYNLVIENGNPLSTDNHGNGGAIYNERGTVRATDIVFRNNRSNGSDSNSGNGGAIYTTSTSTNGQTGGGEITLTDCDFQSNGKDANGVRTRFGGALFSDTLGSNLVRVTRSRFIDNAAYDGGAIARRTGSMIIERSLFLGNSASDTANPSGGGAIDNLAIESEPTLTILDSTFLRNTASISGGAIFNDRAALSIANSVFQLNTVTSAATYGGAAIAIIRGTAIIDSSRVLNGSAINGKGGGIYNNSSSAVTVNTTSFISNTTGTGYSYGGGISNDALGTNIKISTSLFTGNSSSNGGGIHNKANLMKIYNSTVVSNTAYFGGGGIYNEAGILDSTNNTIVSNNSTTSSVAGVYNETTFGPGPIAYLKNTIVANNTPGSNNNCFDVVDSGYNLEYPGTGCGFTNHGVRAEPRLGVLQDNGGLTFTMGLTDGSPAIDAGFLTFCADLNTVKSLDQRGYQRPFPTGGACDIGAFEGRVKTRTVTSNGDDSNPGTLRNVIAAAQADTTTTDNIINFDLGLYPATITLKSYNNSGHYDLEITKNLTIVGRGANLLNIENNPAPGTSYKDRIFEVQAIAGKKMVLNLSGVTLLNGRDDSGGSSGGAIYNAGKLNVDKCVFQSNVSQFGGAINNGSYNGGIVTITNSTFFNNGTVVIVAQPHYGGAIYSNVSASVLTIANSTFKGNGQMTSTNGGAIYNSGGIVDITNATLAGNFTAAGGAGIVNDGAGNALAILKNTIVNHTTNFNCGGQSITDGGNNLQYPQYALDSCHFTKNVALTDPRLTNILNYYAGGTTQTLPPAPGGGGINTGDNGICSAIPVNNKDQNGTTRPINSICDIGAYEGSVP